MIMIFCSTINWQLTIYLAQIFLNWQVLPLFNLIYDSPVIAEFEWLLKLSLASTIYSLSFKNIFSLLFLISIKEA